MSLTQWARLRLTEPGRLRRGAWYRVVRLTAAEAVLDVKRLPMSWGARYGVCPNCRARARLEERATSMRCPKCNGFFDIGWDNS